MSLLDKLRRLLGGGAGEEDENISEGTMAGGISAAAGPSGHHQESRTPVDDLGAQGGPPSHEDPLEPRIR